MRCPICQEPTKILSNGLVCNACKIIFPKALLRKKRHRSRKSLVNHHFEHAHRTIDENVTKKSENTEDSTPHHKQIWAPKK